MEKMSDTFCRLLEWRAILPFLRRIKYLISLKLEVFFIQIRFEGAANQRNENTN